MTTSEDLTHRIASALYGHRQSTRPSTPKDGNYVCVCGWLGSHGQGGAYHHAELAVAALGEQLAWSPSNSQTFFSIVDENAHESARVRNEAAQEAADKLTARLRRAEAAKAAEEDRLPLDIRAIEPIVYTVWRRIPPTVWEPVT